MFTHRPTVETDERSDDPAIPTPGAAPEWSESPELDAARASVSASASALVGEGKHARPRAEPRTEKDPSARFRGDAKLEEIETGATALGDGDRGRAVTKLQQALIDLGYDLPRHGVDGAFGPETEAAVKKYQADSGLPETGKFDAATIAALHASFDTRKPYLDAATLDPSDPGTRRLEGYEKDHAFAAMVPARGVGGVPATFTEDLPGKGKYGDRMKAHLKAEIDALNKELFADKKDLRADPAKNFHDWSVLEGPAAAGKAVTDGIYGSYATKPAMTHAGGTLIDQWEDEIAINASKAPDELEGKARDKVWYLIASNSATLNAEHGAVPSGSEETAILTPIVETFVDSDAKVQKLLELDIGWEGAELAGQVFVQRYKKSSDLENRKQLWELFHTCIHEYIHTLKHDDFDAYASRLAAAGDEIRENTLIEGFCDFFTDNVRAGMSVDEPLQNTIEGPYFKTGVAPPSGVAIGRYPSRRQAEQVVSVVGIKNAQEAYFHGKVDLIGGS